MLIRRDEEIFPRGKPKKSTPKNQKDGKPLLKKKVIQKQQSKAVSRDGDLQEEGAKDLLELLPEPMDADGKVEVEEKRREKKKVESVSPLSFQDLYEGMKLLGCVLQVRELDVGLILPGGMMGVLPATNVSAAYRRCLQQALDDPSYEPPPLRSMFAPGDVLPVVVHAIVSPEEASEHKSQRTQAATSSSKRPRSRVVLSVAPADLNGEILPSRVKQLRMPVPCSVVSEEDHGYVIETGISKRKGFMAKKKLKIPPKIKDAFGPGFWFVGCVSATSEAVLQVAFSNASDFQKPTAQENSAPLLPGALVDLTVSKVLKNGLRVTHGTDGVGTVHLTHLKDHRSKPQSYTVGQKVKGRLLYSIHLTVPPMDAFTLRERLVRKFPRLAPGGNAKDIAPKEISVGQLIEAAKVIRCDGSRSYLALGSPGVVGYLQRRSLASRSAPLPGVGTELRVRAVSYNPIDELFRLSAAPKMLSSAPLSSSSLAVGDRVGCTIRGVDPVRGADVRIEGKIKAWVPPIHLSRKALKAPPKMTLAARVLDLEPSIRLTLRKELVSMEDASIKRSMKEVRPGDKIRGVVVQVSAKGLLVASFGDLKGYIQRKDVSLSDPGQRLSSAFRVGQPVVCVVDQVDPQAQRMRLLLEGTEREGPAERREGGCDLAVGRSYDVTVKRVVPGMGLEVDALPSLTPGFIPMAHCSDFPTLGPVWLEAAREGLNFKAVLFSKSPRVIFSMKESVVSAEGSFPTRPEDIREGMIMAGAVHAIQDYGVFLNVPLEDFPGSALVHKRHLADQFVDNLKESVAPFLSIGQTMIGRVKEVRQTAGSQAGGGQRKRRKAVELSLSTRVSDLVEDAKESSISNLRSYLQECHRLCARSDNEAFRRLKPGDEVVTRVLKRMDTPDGPRLILELPGGAIHGVVQLPTTTPDSAMTPEPGTELVACVLHLSPTPSLHHPQPEQVVLCIAEENSLTGLGALQERRKKGLSLKQRRKMRRLGLPYIVVADLPPYLFVARHPDSHDLVFLPHKKHLNDALPRPPCDAAGVGRRLRVCSKSALEPWNLNLALPVDASSGRAQKDEHLARKRARLSSLNSTEDEEEERKAEGDEERPDSAMLDLSGEEEQAEEENEEEEVLKVEEEFQWLEEEPPEPSEEERIEERPKETQSVSANSMVQSVTEGWNIGKTSSKEWKATAAALEKKCFSEKANAESWIALMVHHLQVGDVDGARSVGQKALQGLPFREESEKLKVWVALLNLENKFGTPESLEEVFQESIRSADDLEIFRSLIEIYRATDKTEEAQALYEKMLRKFKGNLENFIAYGKFLFSNQKPDEGRGVFQRALKSLPKADHVEVTHKFAQLEFAFGNRERGTALMESLVSSFPKRTDLWIVFADILVKYKDIPAARSVFQRAAALDYCMNPRRMKAILSRWLDLETAHGSPQQVALVKHRVAEYIESQKRGPPRSL